MPQRLGNTLSVCDLSVESQIISTNEASIAILGIYWSIRMYSFAGDLITQLRRDRQSRDTQSGHLVSIAAAAHKLMGKLKPDLLAADLRLLEERHVRLRLLHRHLAVTFDDFPCGSRNRRPDLVDRLADPVSLGGCLYAAVDLDLCLGRDNVRFSYPPLQNARDGSSSLVICQFLDREDLMCQLLDGIDPLFMGISRMGCLSVNPYGKTDKAFFFLSLNLRSLYTARRQAPPSRPSQAHK